MNRDFRLDGVAPSRQALGAALLEDAALRASHSEIAAFALMADAKDDAAAAFYRHHGFVALDEGRRR